jgi:hypothetical protein
MKKEKSLEELKRQQEFYQRILPYATLVGQTQLRHHISKLKRLINRLEQKNLAYKKLM